ncbi:exodeoxyribonuclease I [Orbaceae bacterium ESL0721]|nr:exodeoxyribonuclease I [Orbaceae bacterium ESL0721]
MHNNRSPSFFFHDYETFGINPALDRPAQFAGIRTDSDFNIIDDPLVIYCQPAPDYLPNPEAVLITGITPQEAMQKGVCEAEFAKQIHQQFSVPNSCIVGYNNIRFDDEVTRNIFYRNFYDPYIYCNQNGSSRWDLLDLVRACYALRPEGINWPQNESGLPSFRLEHLTKANQISHEHAHDAMSDVYATIAIAKLIKEKQPKLFDYFFQLRHKNRVAELIDVVNMTPIVHVSGMFGASRGNLSLVSPIAWHPTQRNLAIVCDLTGDLDPLINLSVDEIREKLYTKTEDLAVDESRIPLKQIHINKCPIVAPINTLRPENGKRLNIDIEHCLANVEKLRQHQLLLQQKIGELFCQTVNYPENRDVDAQIYKGFLNSDDKLHCNLITATEPKNLETLLTIQFNDPRLKPLFLRYKARNYPQSLSEQEAHQWAIHCQDRLNIDTIQHYLHKLDELATNYAEQPEKLALLKALYNYCHYLVG